MYVAVIRCFLSLISRHNFIASPWANRSRYQKYLCNLASPMSWDHVHRVWWQSGGNPLIVLCSPTGSKSRQTSIQGENWVSFSAQWLSDACGRDLWKQILRGGESRSVAGRWVNLLTRTRTRTHWKRFVCTCHCFQTDKVKQDKMNLDKLYIILKV